MIVLRSALFNAWFFGLTFVLGLYGIVVRLVAPTRALALARLWAKLVLAGARVLCGITVEVTGTERLPDGAVLLASQHQSAFDTLIWATLLPRFSYIYKSELARIPLFGPLLVAAGQIPLDRGASVASVRALIRATQAAAGRGRQIVMFPEGTRVAVGAETAIKGGIALVAARTGLPIHPVATDSGRFWGRRAFMKRPGCIRVHVGAPIPPSLPAPQLEAALRQSWREAWAPVRSVDKSVDLPPSALKTTDAVGSQAVEDSASSTTAIDASMTDRA